MDLLIFLGSVALIIFLMPYIIMVFLLVFGAAAAILGWVWSLFTTRNR